MKSSSSTVGALQLLRHQAYLRALARDLVRDRHAAEDLVQQVLAYALERPPRSAGSLRAWFRKVTRHMAINRATSEDRRRQRETAVAREEADDSWAQADEGLTLRSHVVEAVQRLPRAYRSAVYLRYFDELSPREVARRLGISEGAARSRLKRARAMLRERLEERYERRRLNGLLLWAAGLRSSPGPPVAAAGWKSAVATAAVAFFAFGGPLPLASVRGASEGASSGGVVSPPSPPRALASAVRRAAPAPSAAAAFHVDLPSDARTVAVRVYDEFARPLAGVPLDSVAHGAVLGSARSGSDGFATLPAGSGLTRFVARREGWSTLRCGVSTGADSVHEPVLVVGPSLDIEGSVTDEHGRPVAGARIAVVAGARFAGRFDVVLDNTALEEHRTRTADDGTFRLAGVPDVAGARLDVLRPGFARGQAPLADRVRATLFARPSTATTVRGVVVDAEGREVSGAWVACGHHATQTDESGTFALDLRPRNQGRRYLEERGITDVRTIWAVHGGRLARHTVSLSGELPAHLEMSLDPALAADLRGTVRGADGGPRGGVEVWLRDATLMSLEEHRGVAVEWLQRGGSPTAVWEALRTDDAGVFRFPVRADRTYRVAARHPETNAIVLSEPVRAGDAVTLDLGGEATVRVAGVVRDTDGNEVEGAVVYAVRVLAETNLAGGPVVTERVEVIRRTTSTAEGRFELGDVPATSTRLAVHGDSVVPKTVPWPRGASGFDDLPVVVERRAHVQVHLRQSEAVRLRAWDASGRLLPIYPGRAQVVRWPLERQHAKIADGVSGVLSVPTSAARLTIDEDGRPIGDVEVSLESGSITPIWF